MKTALLTLVLLGVLGATPAAGKPSDRLVVTARVAEIPKNLPTCGILAVRAVIRYEVIAVIDGRSDATSLYVVVLCPARYRVGTHHRLVLRPVTPRDSYIDMFDATAPRYRVLQQKRVKP